MAVRLRCKRPDKEYCRNCCNEKTYHQRGGRPAPHSLHQMTVHEWQPLLDGEGMDVVAAAVVQEQDGLIDDTVQAELLLPG